MATIDDLKVIDGYFDGDKFIMRGIGGSAVYGIYKAAGLRSMANLVGGNDPLTLIIDKEQRIHVPVKLNHQLQKELRLIADELENSE